MAGSNRRFSHLLREDAVDVEVLNGVFYNRCMKDLVSSICLMFPGILGSEGTVVRSWFTCVGRYGTSEHTVPSTFVSALVRYGVASCYVT